MIHPLPSKAAPETRERWQKAAEENIRQGYYLEIDNANEEARWRHLWKAPLWQDWGRVADILEHYAPKHPNAFKLIRRERRSDETAEATPVEIELPEPEPEPEPETENNQEEEAMPENIPPIVLTKPWYRSGEIKYLAGVSSTTLSRYRDQIEHRRAGDGPTSPVEYSARGLQALLAGRGIEATIAPTATAWEGVQSAQKAAAKAPEPVKPAVEEHPEAEVSVLAKDDASVEKLREVMQPIIQIAHDRDESSGDGEVKAYTHRPILTPAPNVLPWDELPQAEQDDDTDWVEEGRQAYRDGLHQYEIPEEVKKDEVRIACWLTGWEVQRNEEARMEKESPTQRLVAASRELETARDLGDEERIRAAEKAFQDALEAALDEANSLRVQAAAIERAIKRTRRREKVLRVFGL